MAKDDRLAELMAEMLIKQDQMVGELQKLNLQTSENTRAVLKLADKVEKIADLEGRVSKLERTVFK